MIHSPSLLSAGTIRRSIDQRSFCCSPVMLEHKKGGLAQFQGQRAVVLQSPSGSNIHSTSSDSIARLRYRVRGLGGLSMSDSVTVDPPPMSLLVKKYQQLQDVVADIAATSAADVDDVQVAELVRVNERVVRALAFQGLKRLQEVNDRGLFRKAGQSTLHRFVMSELRVTRGDASSRLKALDAAGELLSMQGEALPPKCPAAAQALAEGAPEVYDVVDAWMTDNARTSTPTELEVCGREVLARVDPDGSLTDDTDRKRNRGLSDGPQGLDMMAKITGNLDPQTLALFRTVMDVWAAPGMNNPDDPNSPVGAVDDPSMDAAVIEAAAERDSRSRAQRQHDAFKAILKTILEYKLLGTSHRGLPVQ
ncbi:DUF222 domain-containing protein, partial [Kitasatospora arboriphila]|uniref:DUF222 domain-containing protein n=1 Tax=Kitasatospora arboriphila TaxID=258052 RepID=UPI0012EB8DAA